ncbi:GNAT family N-acetyltransferase [bacterium]|nr:GNAT family N-acetyltransferase [bacterium]
MPSPKARRRRGDDLSIQQRTYPLPSEDWARLIAFWQTEWEHTDVDWLAALRGDYADTLTIQLVSGVLGGRLVGTASVYYPRLAPEVCCLADVLTLREFRGRGIAARLSEQAVQVGFAAGCRVAYLGNKPTRSSVYAKMGFARINGAVMRRAAPGHESRETEWYAPGQPVTVRPTVWGDLPGVAALMAQPLGTMAADFPRGLLSLEPFPPTRCVSNFTSVWNDVQGHGGAMVALVGATPHRVLGFGSLTLKPGRAPSTRAVMDAVTHDHYASRLSALLERLLDEARARRLRAVGAWIAAADAAKNRAFRQAGFRPVERSPQPVRVGEPVIDGEWLAARPC